MKERHWKIDLWVCPLFLIFLCYLLVSENVVVHNTRKTEGFCSVEEYTRQEIPKEGTPAGSIVEYTFSLGENLLSKDSTLAFYIMHQYAEVYIGDEQVYSLFPSKEIPMIRTTGSNWVVIPIQREDAGKEVRIVLTPVYKNVVHKNVEFLIGSYQAIYVDRLKKDLPLLLICLWMMLMGGSIIIVGIYSRYKYKTGWELVFFGIFEGGVALWRFTDTRFSPFLCPDKPVLLLYISFFTMIFSVIPLIRSQKKQVYSRISEYYCTAVAGIATIQLLIQICGIADLRQSLIVDHLLILICILLLGNFFRQREPKKKCDDPILYNKIVFSCLVMGIVADMLSYYVRKTSSGLLYTMFALLIYTIYVGLHYIDGYTRQERKLMEKEQQIMQVRASAMMNQIKSHMIFNVLNAISGMCKYDPEKADRTILKFARYLRMNINLMEDDKPVPFRRVLQNLDDYIALEQVRFGDKIRFKKEIQVHSFSMPLLLLQPLVENAIKHGIKAKPEGGTITLRTWEIHNKIYISIHDDGMGFDTKELTKTNSVGIHNIRSRLEYNMNGTLDIKSVPGEGTTATICFDREEAEK